jgi:hypothetical protein
MFTYKKFKTEINYVLDYHQYPLSEYILNIWYEFLSQHLTEEEFKLAIAKAVIEEKDLPTPKQLVELVKGQRFFHRKSIEAALAARKSS